MDEPDCDGPVVVENGIDNSGFKHTLDEDIHETLNETPLSPDRNDTKKRNWLVDFLIDFFDPTVAVQMAQICVRLRENRGRAILNFMFFVYLIVLGPAFAESEHEYNYTRLRFDWSGIDYIDFASYTRTLGFIMFAVVMLLKKWLKLSDMFICIVSSTLGCVARFLYVIIVFNCAQRQITATHRNCF